VASVPVVYWTAEETAPGRPGPLIRRISESYGIYPRPQPSPGCRWRWMPGEQQSAEDLPLGPATTGTFCHGRRRHFQLFRSPCIQIILGRCPHSTINMGVGGRARGPKKWLHLPSAWVGTLNYGLRADAAAVAGFKARAAREAAAAAGGGGAPTGTQGAGRFFTDPRAVPIYDARCGQLRLRAIDPADCCTGATRQITDAASPGARAGRRRRRGG
jgi:hypothetical protein